MNDVPVVAAPPARDHAPPERGQEPAPSDAFAAALGAAQPAEAPPPAADPAARTAPAEGKKAEGDSSGPDTRKTADADTPALVTAPAAIVLPQPAAPVAAAPAPTETAPVAVSAVPAATAHSATVRGGVAAEASVPARTTTAAQDAPSAPQAGTPQASDTAPPAPQSAVRQDAQAEAAVAENAPTAGPAVPGTAAAHRPSKPRRGEHTGPARGAEHTRPHAPARPAVAHAAPAAVRGPFQGQAAGERPADAPAQAQAAAPADPQAPVTARADALARTSDRPAEPGQQAAPRVRVRDVPDVARATLRVAVRQNGSAMARISLHPADLGGVRITMRVHDGAVSATLAAETPAAAQALTQTVSDLRRSLESQGLQITSLDVHVAGDGPASSGDRRQAADLARAMSTTTDRAASEDVVDITTELHLVPLGTQVDVLA
jgi:flagellar hook-length control protein FliK